MSEVQNKAGEQTEKPDQPARSISLPDNTVYNQIPGNRGDDLYDFYPPAEAKLTRVRLRVNGKGGRGVWVIRGEKLDKAALVFKGFSWKLQRRKAGRARAQVTSEQIKVILG